MMSELDQARLRRRVRALPVLERAVLSWRYGLEADHLTVRQVASRLGVGVATVDRIERRALARLREKYAGEERAAA
jgi:DNA-directed RNA polymerase specialized sigma subunit